MINGERMILSALRAIYRPTTGDLIIADLHLGKTAHFRKHGIPVPATLQESDLARLASLIAQFQPGRLIIAGDMFHQSMNSDIDLFAQWRQAFNALPVLLILGNHDRLKKEYYQQLDIDVVNDEYISEGVSIVHEHKCDGEHFCISGHIHPGVVIGGRAKQAVRMPCYAIGRHNMVLPAFSEFTGICTRRPDFEVIKYIAIGNGQLFEL